MTSLTRPSGARQDCHHAKEPFAAAFYAINQRRDISSTAKLVYAHLVTLRRTQREATQTEIGDALGCSRHQVWRAIGELVAADLVHTIRYGLGRPNGYVLLGLEADDLDGRATGRRPASQPGAGQVRTYARVPSYPKKESGRGEGYAPRDYLETRYGSLAPRT